MRSCCPACDSIETKKNGHTYNGKQNHLCKECGRQFVQNPTQKLISELGNHISAIKYFICHYNLQRALHLPYIEANFRIVFEMQLNGWYTNPAMWPKKRNLSIFRQWFDVEIHSTAVDTLNDAY